jgi:hypothetical protein
MKRLLFILLAVIIWICPVSAQHISIPDTAFYLALISEGVDTDGDGYITYSEAEEVSALDVSIRGISDMTGIENFLFLDTLICSENQLTALNVTSIRSLSYFNCLGNDLKNLDVTQNELLVSLVCGYNHLSSLDVTNNPNLVTLDIGLWHDPMGNDSLGNNLSSLDLSKNPALEMLNCNNNLLQTLDISNNTALVELWLTEMESLHEICVWTTPFPPAGVNVYTMESPNLYFTTECRIHQSVHIPDPNFLDALIERGVDTNDDKRVSFGEAEATLFLDINSRQISDMTGIEAFTALDSLFCRDNEMTTLDLSNCTKLKKLDCSSCPLTGLDLSNQQSLTELYCSYIFLDSLDVSTNAALETLACDWNILYTLDLSNNMALEFLNCHANQLSSLDVTRNTSLTELKCSGNHITDLDVSENPSLLKLKCHVNDLSSLDVSHNVDLTHLYCGHNPLTSLDISNSIMLKELSIESMFYLEEVCVWTVPFPPEGMAVFNNTDTPNAYYTTECSTSGNELHNEGRISIYPNPTHGSFQIEAMKTAAYSIEISTSNGQLLHSTEFEGNSCQIDLSSFNNGVYFITIRSEDFLKTEKIIKL